MKVIDDFDRELAYELPDGHKKRIRKERGYDKKYYETHKDEILKKQKDNAEKHRQYNRKYYNNNPEKERQRKKDSGQEATEKRKEYKKEYNRMYYLRRKMEKAVS